MTIRKGTPICGSVNSNRSSSSVVRVAQDEARNSAQSFPPARLTFGKETLRHDIADGMTRLWPLSIRSIQDCGSTGGCVGNVAAEVRRRDFFIKSIFRLVTSAATPLGVLESS